MNRLRNRSALAGLILAVALGVGAGPAAAGPARAEPPSDLIVTHGVASGDVTAASAVVWARASGPAQLHVEYDTDPAFSQPKLRGSAAADPTTDYTAQLKLEGLEPDTTYYYRVWFSGAGGQGRSTVADRPAGAFRTAPAAATSRPVSFVWGGDLGGQRYCRRVDRGYAIFAAMGALEPDFFIANGDLIYADGDCPADGPDGPGGWQNVPGDFASVADPSLDWTDLDQVREVIRRHWRYNRADQHFQRFLSRTPMYAQWDDHEVINDFGAGWSYWNAASAGRPGYPNLVAAGREALFSYAPIDRNPVEPERIYRSFNWGQDLDLFIVDARSYRSRNDLADTPEHQKTLLGRAQLAWLREGLAGSRATWKVVSSDVPIAIPTGSNAAVFGRDAWANGTAADFSAQTGFERELLDLLAFLDAHDVKNVVFVTTDVHFAQSIRYEVDADGDGDRLAFHELVSGPLNAVRGQPGALDPTLNPQSLYAEGGIFNFGHARLQRMPDGRVHLLADVRGEDGLPRPGSALDLAPS